MPAKITIRSDLQSNIPYVVVMLVPWLLGLSLLFKRPQIGLAVVLAYFPLFLYWLRSFRVSFSNDDIAYTIGPIQIGKVNFKDIQSVTYQRMIGSKRPIFTIQIDARRQTLSINAKPFSKHGINEISKLLVSVLPAAVVDSEIVRFAQDDFSTLGLSWRQRSRFLAWLAWIIFLATLAQLAFHAMT